MTKNIVFNLILLLIGLQGLCFAASVTSSDLATGLYLKNFRQRQSEVRRYVIDNVPDNEGNAFLKIQAGKSIDFEATLKPILEILGEEQDPDFYIIQFVRLMFETDAHREELVSYLTQIPLWVNRGDDLRVYWSENHMIMYTSSRFLLEQLLGEDNFYPKDEYLREKLIWWLQSKIESGFFEFYSYYLRFSLTALLNLYDFSADQEIKELSRQAIIVLFKELSFCFNSDGHCFGAAGRIAVVSLALHNVSSARPFHLLSHLFLGTPADFDSLDEWTFNIAVTALASSDIDLSPAIPQSGLSPSISKSRSIGAGVRSGRVSRRMMSKSSDRIVGALSFGGYAHPDFIAGTVDLVNEMDLWDHSLIKEYQFARNVPRWLLRPMSMFASTFTEGSVLSAEWKIWKNEAVSLSSLENFHPGKKGFQQMPWVAGTADLGTLTVSLETDGVLSPRDMDNNHMNNQLPLVVQNQNVAVVAYNPNGDLEYYYPDSLEVAFVFQKPLYDEVVEKGNWIVGRRKESYVAVFRHCVSDPALGEEQSVFVCYDHQQIWLVVVGDNQTHGSFQQFVNVVLNETEVETNTGRTRCVYGRVKSGENEAEALFCKELGNINKALLVVSMIFVAIVALCVAVWRRKIVRRRAKTLENSEDN